MLLVDHEVLLSERTYIYKGNTCVGYDCTLPAVCATAEGMTEAQTSAPLGSSLLTASRSQRQLSKIRNISKGSEPTAFVEVLVAPDEGGLSAVLADDRDYGLDTL